MAQSRQLQLRAAVAALLAGLSVDGGVHQDREFALPTDKVAQLHVNFSLSQPLSPDLVFTSHPRDWRTEIELVILARKSGAVEAADAADALWVDAYAAVMADQTLGGLAWEMLPGEASNAPDQADTSVCRLTWTVIVHHRTSNDTLTS
jgi:hypothetical protein